MSEKENVIEYLEQLKKQTKDRTLKEFVDFSLELLKAHEGSDLYNEIEKGSVIILEKYLQTKNKDALKCFIKGMRWLLK